FGDLRKSRTHGGGKDNRSRRGRRAKPRGRTAQDIHGATHSVSHGFPPQHKNVALLVTTLISIPGQPAYWTQRIPLLEAARRPQSPKRQCAKRTPITIFGGRSNAQVRSRLTDSLLLPCRCRPR